MTSQPTYLPTYPPIHLPIHPQENVFTYHWVENKAPLRLNLVVEQTQATAASGAAEETDPQDETNSAANHHNTSSTTAVSASIGRSANPNNTNTTAAAATAPEQMSLILLAMRNVDLKEAKSRSLAFAMRLWEEKNIPKKYKALCQPTVALGLVKW